MKLLFENWRGYASSRIDEAATRTTVVQTRQDLVDMILLDPDQAISIDGPKGSTKMFGGETPFVLPFDYGEYPMLINPADGMGWDIILMPGNFSKDKNLFPVGHAPYKEGYLDKFGNDKVILAKNGDYSEESKDFIEDFFANVKQFDKIVWY